MPNHQSAHSPLRQHLLQQLHRLWPAIKGSLAEVHKPCIRPHCPAGARGGKHPAFILSFTEKGRPHGLSRLGLWAWPMMSGEATPVCAGATYLHIKIC